MRQEIRGPCRSGIEQSSAVCNEAEHIIILRPFSITVVLPARGRSEQVSTFAIGV